jgi:hypothetical protein
MGNEGEEWLVENDGKMEENAGKFIDTMEEHGGK